MRSFAPELNIHAETERGDNETTKIGSPGYEAGAGCGGSGSSGSSGSSNSSSGR